MILTPLPTDVVPLLDECLPEIRHALLDGIEFANVIQPERDDRTGGSGRIPPATEPVERLRQARAVPGTGH